MRYEASTTSILVTATANAPLVAIRAPATERGVLRELGVTLQAATSTRLGLTRATTVSVTPASTVAGVNQEPGAPAGATLLVAGWATAPVVSASYMRRITLPAAIGAGFIWTWAADMAPEIGTGAAIGELVICNLVAVAPSLFDWYAIWED